MAVLAQSFNKQRFLDNNQLRTSSNTLNQTTIQDGRVVVQNVQRVRESNHRCTNAIKQENGAVLDEEELLFLAGEQGNTFDADVDNQPVQDLPLNEDNIFQADECDVFDSGVNDVRLPVNYSWPIYPHVGSSKSTAGVMDDSNAYTGQKRHNRHPPRTTYDVDELLKPHHFCFAVIVINVSRGTEVELAEATRNKLHVKMNDSVCVEKRGIQKSLALELGAMKAVFENLEAEVDQNETDLRSGEIERKNLLITNENLVTECLCSEITKDLTAKLNALHDLNECFRAENAKVKQHYKELYDSIKITRAGSPVDIPLDVEPYTLDSRRIESELHLYRTLLKENVETLRLLPLGDQWPLTRNTPPKVLPTKQWKAMVRTSSALGRTVPLVRSTALKSDCLPADPQETIAPVVQIVLWYLDSGCSKHMTGDRSRLRNFMKKFIGTVRFGNNHFGAIMGYGDYVIDLEVAFRKHTCFVRDLDGVDLIKGSVNGVVERRNRTLVEAARTMLIFFKAPLFLWAEVVSTACYTQNRSLIHTLHNKTPYELVHDKKLDLSFLCIFGALCYPTNDSKDLSKLKAKADIGFFVGYALNRKGYKIYNKRTQQIMETIHVTFDELTKQTAHVHSSSGAAPNLLTPGTISSGLIPNSAPAIPYVPPTNKDLELLFQPMFDEYFETPTGDHLMPPVPQLQPRPF
ncbi:retrovirus-related pol polyprotein from transposon TNT 1-94, partial [Tanacetum coccineum]